MHKSIKTADFIKNVIISVKTAFYLNKH